jgi:hypothetical protein
VPTGGRRSVRCSLRVPARYLQAVIVVQIELTHASVELTDGSLLFLPRGVWHATSSSETFSALNRILGQRSWFDLHVGTR